MGIKFRDLYIDEHRSKGPRPIRTNDGKIWKFKEGQTVEIKEEDIIHKQSIVEFKVKDENQLETMIDTVIYTRILKQDISRLLKIDKWNFDFVVTLRMINYLTHRALNGAEFQCDNSTLLYAVDLASAGGCVLAEKGTYDGKFNLYDISNSYNKFFVDWNPRSNPVFQTVTEISKDWYCLYRLKIEGEENFTQEQKWKFRTNRTWFTYWDIEIFKMFDIKFTLKEGKNNCIRFMDSVEADFEWMETLNEEKQKATGLKKSVIKNLLSSFWGNVCKYWTITNATYKERTGNKIPSNYFHKVDKIKDEEKYIDPDQIYLYGIAMNKPFVLAYGRYRLLKQIHRVEKKGYKVLYAHTDSIITDCPEKYFNMGTNIGQWKLEKTSENGVKICNVAKKEFY